jgi:hypothetical protein
MLPHLQTAKVSQSHLSTNSLKQVKPSRKNSARGPLSYRSHHSKKSDDTKAKKITASKRHIANVLKHHKMALPTCTLEVGKDFPCDWAEKVLCFLCDGTDQCLKKKKRPVSSRRPVSARSARKKVSK